MFEFIHPGNLRKVNGASSSVVYIVNFDSVLRDTRMSLLSGEIQYSP
jgi:hypothetical protein